MTELQKRQNEIADAHATAAWASGVRWTCRCAEGCGPAAKRWYEPECVGPADLMVVRRPMIVRSPGRLSGL